MTAADCNLDGGIRRIAWPADAPTGYSERGRMTARTTNPIASPSRSVPQPAGTARQATPSGGTPSRPLPVPIPGPSPGFSCRPAGPARSMTVSKNLYVGNLAFGTTQADLEQLFGQHGTVTKVQIITDRETGQSRGFAFVEMASGAEEAIKALNLSQFQGRSITVNEARPREDRPRGGGGGGGGRGGYGGGGGRRY